METKQATPAVPSAPTPRAGANPWPQAAAPSAARVREMLGWRLIPSNAGAHGRD